MSVRNGYVLAGLCLQLSAWVGAHAESPSVAEVAAPLTAAERHARPCQPESLERTVKPQGTMLWGTRRGWDGEQPTDARSSVLVSVGLTPPRREGTPVKPLKLAGGHLMAASASGSSPEQGVVHTVLQGRASDGKPVEVAICEAERSAEDSHLVWYHIEAWNERAQEWENPCVALGDPKPRALAVSGVWDGSGAHHESSDQFTFACENGAITKCISWGYKPWERHGGHSMADVHQACTRMARADYCGDGFSHTHRDNLIDMYDRFGVIARATQSTAEWDLRRASFEAAWAPDGATCLSRTREGTSLETILRECPRRFQAGQGRELGGGDRCVVSRTDVSPASALLRNQSYDTAGATPSSDPTP